jgi:hypothetical protein
MFAKVDIFGWYNHFGRGADQKIEHDDSEFPFDRFKYHWKCASILKPYPLGFDNGANEVEISFGYIWYIPF